MGLDAVILVLWVVGTFLGVLVTALYAWKARSLLPIALGILGACLGWVPINVVYGPPALSAMSSLSMMAVVGLVGTSWLERNWRCALLSLGLGVLPMLFAFISQHVHIGVGNQSVFVPLGMFGELGLLSAPLICALVGGKIGILAAAPR